MDKVLSFHQGRLPLLISMPHAGLKLSPARHVGFRRYCQTGPRDTTRSTREAFLDQRDNPLQNVDRRLSDTDERDQWSNFPHGFPSQVPANLS